MPVYMDGRQIALLPGERQGTIKIPSGSHTFYSKSPVAALQSNDELQITAEAGKEYFIRGEIIPGLIKVHWRFTQVSSEQGALDVKRLKPMP